jgi:hypothetical protein
MVRGKGEGSIYQRSDGRWEAQIEAGRSPAGRRRYARGVRRTRKDAQKELKELQRPSDAGVMPGQASMVSVFMAWWLGHVVPGTVTDETVTRYRWITDHWITPHVGTVRFNKLTPTHMQAMLVRLEEAGLSPSPARWPAPSRADRRVGLNRPARWGATSPVSSTAPRSPQTLPRPTPSEARQLAPARASAWAGPCIGGSGNRTRTTRRATRPHGRPNGDAPSSTAAHRYTRLGLDHNLGIHPGR